MIMNVQILITVSVTPDSILLSLVPFTFLNLEHVEVIIT